MNFKSCHIVGNNIDEVYFKMLRELAENGRQFVITKGSCAGDTRLEFDSASGTILNPIQYSDTGQKLPLSITVPAGCPNPVTEDMIYEYFNNYLLNSKLEPSEHYRYSTFVTGGEYKIPFFEFHIPGDNHNIGLGSYNEEVIVPNQLDFCISHFCEETKEGFNFGNNHCRIMVGYPESSWAYLKEYSNEMERGTAPCLQLIDMKMLQENNEWYLCFYVYFRSWDAYSGWPLNNAGLILLQEYIAMEISTRTDIDIKIGPFNFFSKGLHVYGESLEALKIKVGSSAFK